MASLGVCLLVTIIIIIPLLFLTESIVNEIISLYERVDAAIQAHSFKDLLPFLDDKTLQNLYQKVNRYLMALQIDTNNIFLNTLKENSSYGISMLTGTIKNLSLFIVNLFLMLFTMYYLLKDSNMIAAEIKGLIPLPEHQKERIFSRLKDIIYATIYGTPCCSHSSRPSRRNRLLGPWVGLSCLMGSGNGITGYLSSIRRLLYLASGIGYPLDSGELSERHYPVTLGSLCYQHGRQSDLAFACERKGHAPPSRNILQLPGRDYRVRTDRAVCGPFCICPAPYPA